MLTFRFTSLRAGALMCALLMNWCGGSIKAQSVLNDAHVLPPSAGIPSLASGGDLEASLNTHTPPLRADADLVLVPVTVTDSMNRVVRGLDRAHFEVYEGRKTQEIRHFSSEDVPVSLGIVLDTSGSMSSKMERAREAVAEFCRAANPLDEFFMLSFANRPQQIMDFTTSVEEIQGGLLDTSPKGQTALLDAVYLGISKMREAKYRRRALLIISDGGDNHSRYTEGEIRSVVKEADVAIYAMGIYDRSFQTREEALGPLLLQDLAELTGGHAFTLDNPNDLPMAAKIIGSELRNQYVLGYRSTYLKRDGKWRKVRVKLRTVAGFPDLHIHAKTGYYAPAE